MSNQNCCPHCINGYVMELYNEWRCLNCGCRPEYWHKRFLHEPDGQQPCKGPGVPVILETSIRTQIKDALARSRAALGKSA